MSLPWLNQLGMWTSQLEFLWRNARLYGRAQSLPRRLAGKTGFE